MAEALAAVRGELGANAVILNTRSIKRGGLLGFGAKTIIEVTAAEGEAFGRARRAAAGPSPRREVMEKAQAQREAQAVLGRRVTASSSSSSSSSAALAAEPTMLAGDLIKRTYAAAKLELSAQAAARNAAQNAAATTAAAVAEAGVRASGAQALGLAGRGAEEGLSDEVRAVKRMVEKMMRQQHRRERLRGQAGDAPRDSPDLPDKLFDQYLTLLRNEVTEELAEEIVAQVRGKLSPAELEDEQAVREAVFAAVVELVPCEDEAAEVDAVTTDGRPRTIALIGPTGVGKTTTLAKLAATFKLKQGQRVAMVTLDTYRIAAVDQLQTYASIIGVPLHVALTPEELRQALRRCADYDVVLIDTAGRSQRDDDKLEELASFLEAADPHEVHLVLSSTCTQNVLMEVVERFSRVRTDRIIFTKLDEAVSFGVVLNVVRRVNKRLSYITTGQEVPHQIEVGRRERLASLVVGGALHKPPERGS
jgi:flagellar biosynthesis protein FlhF